MLRFSCRRLERGGGAGGVFGRRIRKVPECMAGQFAHGGVRVTQEGDQSPHPRELVAIDSDHGQRRCQVKTSILHFGSVAKTLSFADIGR